MSKSDIEVAIIDALERVAPDHAIDIVDVDVTGATKAPVVRVRIDHEEGGDAISLDEVAEQNAWISDVLDIIDPFPGSYTLEVSSPGLARPLRRERDFNRFAGETVALETTATEGRKRYTGELRGMHDGNIVVACDDGEVSVPFDELKSCVIKPVIDFSGAARKQES